MYKKISTGLVDFDDLNLIEAAKGVESLRYKDSYSYVITPNIDHLARLSNVDAKSSLHHVYTQASLVLCDSRILEKLLRFCNKLVKAVVPGSDLTAYLFDHVITCRDKVLVFGCDNAEMQALYKKYPEFNIEHINPSMGFINKPEEVARLIGEIKQVEADYIFLAVGSPRQEVFASKLKEAGLSKGVALCIGASINFIVGVERRAPVWMQRFHLEWLYRMLQDPARLVKRYSMNAYYLPKVLRNLRRTKGGCK